jgi:hypothetical protein
MSTEKGALFCELVRRALERASGQAFVQEVPLLVGYPPREHRFDLATSNRSFVGEVKAFRWTGGNNIPAAKIATLKEAIQFLHALPPSTRTFLVMQRDLRPSNAEALADYFARLHGHFLGDTTLLELDTATSSLRVVRGRPLA